MLLQSKNLSLQHVHLSEVMRDCFKFHGISHFENFVLSQEANILNYKSNS